MQFWDTATNEAKAHLTLQEFSTSAKLCANASQNEFIVAMELTGLRPCSMKAPELTPVLTTPRIVGSFSVDGKREYHPDKRNLQYAYKPERTADRLPFDLNEGMANTVRKPDNCSDTEKIDMMLKFILGSFDVVKASPKLKRKRALGPEVVCFRGLLRMIMCTPYEHYEPWTILATRYKGSVYLCAKNPPEKVEVIARRTDDLKTVLSYGFKFEQFMLTGKFLQRSVFSVSTATFFIAFEELFRL